MKKEINYEKVIKPLLIFVISGIFGFIYEILFYKIDLGYFIKRGITFGPWIPIYGFGGLLIYALNRKRTNNPIAVFLYSTFICGFIEFLTGYIIYHCFNGLRLWDYNTEIWNWGNIGGYICFRSVTFFGLSGVWLMYLIVPVLDRIASKVNQKLLSFVSILLSSLFSIDIIVSLILK